MTSQNITYSLVVSRWLKSTFWATSISPLIRVTRDYQLTQYHQHHNIYLTTPPGAALYSRAYFDSTYRQIAWSTEISQTTTIYSAKQKNKNKLNYDSQWVEGCASEALDLARLTPLNPHLHQLLVGHCVVVRSTTNWINFLLFII